MKKILFMLLYISEVTFGQSSLCFNGTASNSSYSLASNNDKSSTIHPLDINNDGKMDIVYPSWNCIRYRLGNGNGTFGATSYSIATAGLTYNSIDVVDFNNDNKLDLIAYTGGGDFRYLVNNGNGTFAAPVAITGSGAGNGYILNDFNNDGFGDIIAVNGNTLKCLVNNANNTFSVAYSSTVVTTNTPSAIKSITSGDFNWDGNRDIAYHSDGNLIYLLNGNGLCSFSVANTYSVSGLSNTKLFSYDFNNDTRSDLAIFKFGIGNVTTLFSGLGSNNFSYLTSFKSIESIPANGNYAAEMMLFDDVNNDGLKDIVIDNAAGDLVQIRFGDATYNYSNYQTYLTTDNTAIINLRDFNNDGFLDLLAGSSDTYYTYQLLLGNNSGFSANSIPYIGSWSALKAADFNNDGYTDFVRVKDTLVVYKNNGNGTFTRSFTKALSVTPSTWAKSVDVADYNNDGVLDIIYPNDNGGNITVIFGSTNFVFQAPIFIPSTSLYDKVKAIEVNNDGYADLMTVHQSGTFKIYKNNGGSSFSAMSFSLGVAVEYASADVNSDGFNDIVFSGGWDGYRVLTNISGTTFTSSTDYSLCPSSPNIYAESITSADYNLDGKIDVVASHGGCGGNIYHWSTRLQTVANTFSSAVNYTAAYGQPRKMLTSDINFDSYPDVIAGFTDGYVQIFLNNKSGGFTQLSVTNPVFKVIGDAYQFDVGDFDNDGRVDIIALSQSGELSILYNKSINITPSTAQTVCTGATLTVKKIGNHPNFYWSPGGSTADSIVVVPNAGIQAIIDEGIGGCKSSVGIYVSKTTTCQAVWPGDANNDGTANNLDVLEIGFQYGVTGAARSIVSNTWQPYNVASWIGNGSTFKNKAHIDCNGDGAINSSDTLAIFNNYGLTHAKQNAETVINPQLYIVPDQNAVLKGNWGSSSIYLGEASTIVSNINGLAYTATFDPSIIENNSVWLEYPVSFINPNNDNLHFRKLDFSNGNLFTATTHTIANNVSGYGKIATLHYKINSGLTNDAILNLGLLSAVSINTVGTKVNLTTGTATVQAVVNTVGLADVEKSELVTLSPNPAKQIVTILSEDVLLKLEVFNSSGQLMYTSQSGERKSLIDISTFPEGVYFVKVQSKQGNHVKKLVVSK